jgi:hypothetical protein
MFLIKEVGPTPTIATELTCLNSYKDLVILAKFSFCAMANLVGRTLFDVLTLIFGLVKNLSMTYFLPLGPGKL